MELEVNEFIAVGEEEEVQGVDRYIEIKNKKNKRNAPYQKWYNELPEKLQRIVDDTIYILSKENGEIHQGYNLHQIMKWYKQSKVSVPEFLRAYIMKTEEFKYNEIIEADFKSLWKEIEKSYNTKKFRENTSRMDMLKEICVFFLLDIDLILNGEGYIYEIDSKTFVDNEELELYHKVLCDYYDYGTKEITTRETEIEQKKYSNSELLIKKKELKALKIIADLKCLETDTLTYFEDYKKYLEKMYPDDSTKHFVINKRYAKLLKKRDYSILDGDALKCVNNLIARLWTYSCTNTGCL